MQDNSGPVVCLEQISLRVCEEGFNPMAVPGAFSKLVSEVKNGITGLFGFLGSDEKLSELDSKQKKFFELIMGMPYVSISNLQAYQPEGCSATYLDFLNELVPICEQLKTVEKDVLIPYSVYLARFIANPKTQHDEFTDERHIKDQEKRIDECYKRFSKLYKKASYSSKTQVKNVVQRNADWKPIFLKLNECVKALSSVNRESIQKNLKDCTNYLSVIEQDFATSEDKVVAQGAAQRLARTATLVGKELELFSTTYYRLLSLKGCIENTIESIKKVID